MQIFASAPQMWRPVSHSDEAVDAFRRQRSDCGIEHVFIHAIYLINLGSEDSALLGRSIEALTHVLQVADRIEARGVIFHTGSHKGAGFDAALPRVVEALSRVLDYTPSHTRLIVENSAGMGGSIGSRFSELGAILRGVGSDRLEVCLDTCHLFAAGYELRTPEGLAATLAEFDREVGLNKLVAIHANDSKGALGGGKDRHENIGEGQIGLEGFATFIAHPAIAALPLILEVPGFDGGGPDRENIDRLKRLRARTSGVASEPSLPDGNGA